MADRFTGRKKPTLPGEDPQWMKDLRGWCYWANKAPADDGQMEMAKAINDLFSLVGMHRGLRVEAVQENERLRQENERLSNTIREMNGIIVACVEHRGGYLEVTENMYQAFQKNAYVEITTNPERRTRFIRAILRKDVF